jgi:hypothetical protein
MQVIFLSLWLYLGIHASIGEAIAPPAAIAEEAIDDSADDWTEFDLSTPDVGEVQP